ncbi:MAG: hypothetical protein KJO54_00090 [Gammaproteobacteria bacterium]|nr:hypothetical protein [Gammaproteobacteria bacterium]NNF62001.1 hypothetical protein [Gammaproteobacteria bacterium]
MMTNQGRRRVAVVFGWLALMALVAGGHALAIQSDLVLLLVLVPLFGVLALAFGVSSRR